MHFLLIMNSYPPSSFFFFTILILFASPLRVSARSTAALSITVANLQACFRVIFLHRLQSPLFHLIPVELGWHAHKDKAVFFLLQPRWQSSLIENCLHSRISGWVLKAVHWMSRANWRPDCLHFHFLWYAPHFAFVLSGTWHFYWQDLKGNDKVNQHLHTLFPWCQTARWKNQIFLKVSKAKCHKQILMLLQF